MLGCIVTHTLFLQPEKTGTLGVLNKILRGTGTEPLRNRDCLGEADTNLIPKQVEKGSVRVRGKLIYLATLGSEKLSAPYFKQCFFRWGGLPTRLSQTPRLPVPRQK